MTFDRKAFFDALRPHVNLTTQNVSGLGRVLSYAEERGTSIEHLKYILATAWWETAQTMQPVKEAYWLSEGWRERNLRYYPWYGRGLIQTTWEANYKRMGDEIGVDLTDDPDKLLQWEYALPALFVGMEKGLYTGHSLGDYIDDIDESDDEDFREMVNARRIVNGTDKAATIAKLGLAFENALRASSWQLLLTVVRDNVVTQRMGVGQLQAGDSLILDGFQKHTGINDGRYVVRIPQPEGT